MIAPLDECVLAGSDVKSFAASVLVDRTGIRRPSILYYNFSTRIITIELDDGRRFELENITAELKERLTHQADDVQAIEIDLIRSRRGKAL